MLEATYMGKLRKNCPALLWRKVLNGGLAVLLLVPSSCCRKFYRNSADEEVSHVLAEKDKYPQWPIEQFHVYPDPRARFADTTNPDRPPKPPDDPGAYDLSPNPQKAKKVGIAWIEGFGYLDLLGVWDAENRERLRQQQEAEKKQAAVVAAEPGEEEVPRIGPGASGYDQTPPTEQPPTPGERAFLVSLEQAVELGLINSRDYQTRREDLYLAALPVTLERFAFAAQWFATEETIRERFGKDAPGGPANRWVVNSDVGLTKLFPTGALLLFQIANQTVVNLTGDAAKHTVSESTLTLDFLQPLLRGGGLAVTLEPLTLVERALLYEVREYARYREQFYVYIAGGGNLPGATAPARGYLPILEISSRLANQRKNVDAFQRLFGLFQAFREGELVTQLQVDTIEQNLLQSRNNVNQTELLYRDSLDDFKQQLGLPPGLNLELEASTLQPLREQFRRYETILREFEGATGELESARAQALRREIVNQSLAALSSFLAANPVLEDPAAAAWAASLAIAANVDAYQTGIDMLPQRVRARIEQTLSATPLIRGTEFQKRLAVRWAEWAGLTDAQLTERIGRLGDERRDLEEKRTKLEVEGKDITEAEKRRLAELGFELEVGSLEDALRVYLLRPWRRETTTVDRLASLSGFLQREMLPRVAVLLGRARRERLDNITRQWPEVPAVQVGGTDLLKAELSQAQTVVAQTALTNRLDLMNVRAQLVDAWRQIAVTANALLGVFNVRYRLESFSPGGEAQPFNFQGSKSRHQLFLNGELPLVRKAERNDYRTALIFYQRQRRAVMSFEDQVLADVRSEIRQLRVLAENYTIQKRLVELAYVSVENAEDTFRAPPTPGGQGSQTAAGNAAALTDQLIRAQNSLLQAQNQLYQIWINYLITRMFLYRDLELLPLDFRGVWIDESSCPTPDTGAAGRPTAAQSARPWSGADERSEQLPQPRPVPAPGAPREP